jgi:hypothetical protein
MATDLLTDHEFAMDQILINGERQAVYLFDDKIGWWSLDEELEVYEIELNMVAKGGAVVKEREFVFERYERLLRD